MRTFEVVYDSYQGFGSHVEQARGKRALSLWYIQLSFYNFLYVSMSQYVYLIWNLLKKYGNFIQFYNAR